MPDMPLVRGVAIHACTLQVMCRTGRESQLPYVLNAHKASKVLRDCITKHDSALAGPLKVMAILLLLVVQISK